MALHSKLFDTEMLCLGACYKSLYLTVDTKLDFSTGVADRTGGGADVDPCVVSSGMGNVEVFTSVKLCRRVVPGQRLSTLEEWQPKQKTEDIL